MNAVRLRWLLFPVFSIAGSMFAAQLLLPEISQMFSRHMLSHILLMNFAAPVLGAVFYRRAHHTKRLYSFTALITASTLQLLLLFGWHLPTAMNAVMVAPALSIVMHVSLFVTALWFWQTIYHQADEHVGRALAALLVTGKLYCLAAALLVFAPRSLYAIGVTTPAISLADQQLSGVMMIVACPLSYVLIATVLVTRWLSALHRRNELPVIASGVPSVRCP